MNDITSIIEDCYKSDIVSDRVIKKVIEIIGQKEWQILHDENNDICTTMGELIITLDRIADLKKENAELKAFKEKCKFNVSDIFKEIETENNLTKAKELLLELYDCIPSSMADSCKETLQKVALFFKDSEVEK